jgi:DNA-directed RNA polymerase subunit RPC12/RpoP
MSDGVRDLLVRGIAAAKAKSIDEARFYLERVLRTDATVEQRIKAWLWLSEISDDPAEKRDCLETALAHDPAHPVARRKLAVLEGRLKPEEIIDPDRVFASAPEVPQSIHARRFVCQQCGGRMTFIPDGKALMCSYCSRRQTLLEALGEGAMIEEQDFVVALATVKGHTRPVTTRALRCQGCGASFILAPEMLSFTCPYCASIYVVEMAEVQELIPPEGIVPFVLTREQAFRAALQWLEVEGLGTRVSVTPPTGVYSPVWTFDVGGEIPWRYLEKVDDNWVPRSASKVAYENDLLVPASHALPAPLAKVVNDFRLDDLVTYDPVYLADWPAETYEISMANASLVARRQILDRARERATYGAFGQTKDLQLSSTRLVIEAFKLILLPLWIAHYRDKKKQKQYTVVINGQTGAVRGEKPARGIRKWLSWLAGGE